MHIYWYGQSCFKIQDKDKTVLVNPYSPREAGMRGPNFKADLSLLTNSEDFKQAKKDLKNSFIIHEPGEYEVEDIFVYAVQHHEKDCKSTLYQVEIDGIRLGFLGEIKTVLSDEQLEKLDTIDILFLPVGGNSVLDATKAIEVMNQISPIISIPCSYQIPGNKEKLDPVSKFFKEMSITQPSAEDKLLIKKKDLVLSEETKIIVLNPKTS